MFPSFPLVLVLDLVPFRFAETIAAIGKLAPPDLLNVHLLRCV